MTPKNITNVDISLGETYSSAVSTHDNVITRHPKHWPFYPCPGDMFGKYGWVWERTLNGKTCEMRSANGKHSFVPIAMLKAAAVEGRWEPNLTYGVKRHVQL